MRVVLRIAVSLAVLGAAAVSLAGPQLEKRILRPADDRETSVLAGNLVSRVRRELDQGRVEAGRRLERMAIAFKRSPAQEAELDALLAAQQDPRSPEYQRWLSPDEFAARFGMSDADLAEVSAWLRAHGFAVLGPSRGRDELAFSGTAEQVERAFRTELHEYLAHGELHFANATEPSIPSAYADVVLAIRHLHDFRPRPRFRHDRVSGRFTSSITGNHFIAPADFATLYDLKPLYAAGFDGTGQKLAVVGQSALAANGATTDVDAFRAAAGLPPTHLQQLRVPATGAATVCPSDVGEADLDVEWSGAAAPNAKIVYVYVGVATGKTCATTGSDVWDALHYAVNNALAPVISTSYGACEAANGFAFARTVRGWVRQANAQGQTVAAASGDTGAADCEPRSSQSATTGLAVDVPASIPEVTGAGGTELDESSDPNAYWAATNDAQSGSALQYVPETGWNDTALELAAGNGFASGGGGPSAFFAKPAWQLGAGVPADGQRDVPDVAFSSSADHDGYLYCSQGNCVNGFRNTDQTLGVVGGTSVAAPNLAGILAVIAGGTGSAGLGNVNPKLYALAASVPAAFHDVTTGSNVVPCTPGTPDCPANAPFQLGFGANAGYDRVTGLGSLDTAMLATHWASPVATSTSLTASSPTPSLGATETFTATVTPAGSGPGSPAGGAVQFSVDGAHAGGPVVVTKVSGAYQASYATTGLGAGPHSIGASYGGNLIYQASTAAPLALVVSDFALSVDPNSATVAPGGSVTSTVTVTAQDGFAGTVSLACAPSSASAEIACALQPSSLTLGSGAPSQTAVLTITTTAPQTFAQNALPWLGGEALAAVLLLPLPLGRKRRLRSARLVAAVLFLVASGISCGGGGGGGGSSSANAAARPAAPESLTATAGELQVMLAWTESSQVNHFDLQRSTTNGGPYTVVARPTAPSFTDTGLTAGTTYYYVVDAVSSSGKSPTSSQAAATPNDPGTPPGDYTMTITATSGATWHAVSLSLTVQ